MEQHKDIQLLTELSRLVGKYGPEPFEQLAQRLRSGRFLSELLSLLDAAAQVGRRSKKTSNAKRVGAKKNVSVDDVLKDCQVDSPEMTRVLHQLYQRLVAKTLLPTLQDIRHFSEDNGLPKITAKSRQQAIAPLLRAMASVPPEQIKSLLAKSPSMLNEKDDRSLEAWADIILRSRTRTSSE